MDTKVFIDLDETLIHAVYAGGISSEFVSMAYIDPKTSLRKGDISVQNELYRGTLRPGALDFLTRTREKYGKENVLMLTASVLPYAIAFNIIFGLGFTESQIYDRSLIPYQMEPHREYRAILIDNLPQRENESKLDFLNRSEFKKIDYYRVPDFYNQPQDDFLIDFQV